MRANRKTDTGPERALRSELQSLGLRFRKNFPIAGGDRTVRVDICFPRQKVVIFVDGCFWHGCPDHGTQPKKNVAYWGPKLETNKARDRAVDADLTEAGWAVIRVWEHEPVGDAALRIASAVRGKAPVS